MTDSPLTLEVAKEHLNAWLQAEYTVATGGQSYTIGSRTLTRADLADIRDAINFWQAKVNALERKGRKIRRVRVWDL